MSRAFTKRLPAAAAVVMLAVALVFTGTAPAGDEAMSAKTFRKVANDICRQSRMLREDIVDRHVAGASRPPIAEDVAAFVEEYRSVVRQQIDSLRALHPPARLAPKVAKLLSTAKKALARVVSEPTLLLDGPDPFVSVATRANALGLKECAT